MSVLPDESIDLDGLLSRASKITGYTAPVRRALPSLSEDEDLAVRTVIGEAKHEGQRGWNAVAGVIRNRADKAKQTLKDVVLAPHQFEPWGSRKKELEAIDRNSSTYQRVAQSVLPILRGEAPDPTGGATHFYSPGGQASLGRSKPSWDNGSGFDIGNHRFFKLGYGGKKSAPSAPSLDLESILNQASQITGFDHNAPDTDELLSQAAAITGFDDKSSTPVSPTFKTPQLVTEPVPEAPATVQAQIDAAANPTVKGRVGVWIPENDKASAALFGKRSDFVAVPKEGGTMWVHSDKAKKLLKLKDYQHIQSYVEKNPNALAKITGTAEDVGNETAQGTAVQTVAPDGTELSSKIVTTPETAEQQVKLDQESFPDGTSKIVDAQDVVEQRQSPADLLTSDPATGVSIKQFPVVSVVKQTPNPDGTITNHLSDGSTSVVRLTKSKDGEYTATEVQAKTNHPINQTPAVQQPIVVTDADRAAETQAVDKAVAEATDDGVKVGEDIPTDFKEHVTFENKPDGTDNKEYFIQALIPKLTSRLPGVDATDIEKTLRDTFHHDKGTPLRDIEKGGYYDFQMTPEFYEDAQKNHDRRYANAKQSLLENAVTGKHDAGGDFTSDAQREFGLSDDEIMNIITDPGFKAQIEKDKARYEELLQFHKDLGSDHPEIMAKRGLHYLSEVDATKAIKQDAKEKEAYRQWLKSTGYDDFDYRQTHSKGFEEDKAKILQQYGSFDTLVTKNKENVDYLKTHPFTAIASKLPSFFDNETMQGFNATKKASNADYTKLSDTERQSAEDFGKGLKAYLPNELYTQFHTGVATGLASDLLDIGAGVLRFSNPLFGWATGGKGADWMNRAAEQTRLAGTASEPDQDTALGQASAALRAFGTGVGQLPGIGGATILTDGNPVLGFALHAALTGSNKPVEEQTAGIVKNSIVGGIFDGQAIIEGVGGEMLDSLLTKLGLDTTATTATIIKTLYEKGKHIGFLGGVGGGQAALEGQDRAGILKSAALMASLGITGFGRKPTGKELQKLDTKILRLPDENDKPIDVLFTKKGDGVELTDVTGKVPDGIQQAIIGPTDLSPDNARYQKPKFTDYLKTPKAAIAQRRVAYDAKQNTVDFSDDWNPETNKFDKVEKYVVPPALRPLAKEADDLYDEHLALVKEMYRGEPDDPTQADSERINQKPESLKDDDVLTEWSNKYNELHQKLKEYGNTDAPTQVKPVIHKPSFGEPVKAETPAPDTANPKEVKVKDVQLKSEAKNLSKDVADQPERPKEPKKITSTKNSVVDTEREARGLSPIAKEARRDFGTVWDDAAKEIDKNPDAGINLVRELKNDPKKALTDEENALLLHRKIQLRNQFDERANELIKATESRDAVETAAARIRLAPIQDALDELDRVTVAAGTAAGRGLNARRMMANADFSLAALELKTRAANGGRALSDKEFSDLKKVADDYKAKADLLEKHLADRNAVIAKMETNWPNSRVITAAENLVKKLDVRAEAARTRLAKRGTVLTTGLDPLVLKDLAEIGASHIATAGLDFAKWTAKMVEEFGDKVKPHLDQLWQASNDVFDGLGARDRFIGNRPTDETKLKAWKTRATKRLNELNQKVEQGDFTRKKRVPFTKFDAEAIRLKADVERIVHSFNKGIKKKEMEARSDLEKAQDFGVKYRRAAVLSGPSTLAKLTAAALGRTVTAPMEQLAEHGWGKVFPGLAKQMSREYGFRTIAEAKAITEMLTSGFKDSLRNLKNQESDLDEVFGRPQLLHNTPLEYFGSIHAALKAPVKRGVFARNMELGFAKVIKDGGDPLDPITQMKVGLQAYKASQRGIFMQDNVITKAYKSAINTLERKMENGHADPVGKGIATILQTLMPIVKIPTNFVGETVKYAVGLPVGLAKVAKAYRAGLESMTPEEADLTMRWLKKGSIGAGALALGAIFPDAIGGYYQGRKRDPKDVKAGGIRLFGVNVPSLLLHTPALEAMQIGATFRRVMDSKAKKTDEETQGVTLALIASAIGLVEEVPFVRETANVSKLLDPATRGDFLSDIGKNILVPQLSSQTAAYLDKPPGASRIPLMADPIKRKPEGLWQTIETGIPGLRKNVPEAAPDKSRVSPDAQEAQLKRAKIVTEMDKIEQLETEGQDSSTIKESLRTKLDNKVDRAGLTQTEAARANKIFGLTGDDAYTGEVEDAEPPKFGKYNKNADGLIDRIAGWAEAIGTDPVDAFDKLIAKGERFKRMENGVIIVERMSKDASGAERKRLGGGGKSVKADHFMPLELGGTNAQDNIRLVTTEEWARYTPIENYLAGALHDKKISGKEAQDLIRSFKNGWIDEQEVVKRVGSPYEGSIPAEPAKPSKSSKSLRMPSLRMPRLH